MDVEAEFEPIMNRWGSEEAIYSFLESEFERINRESFTSQLTKPEFEIRPMSAREPFAPRPAGGEYLPPKKDWPAVIALYSVCLLEESVARHALAHEMIHHWEVTSKEPESESAYPEAIDDSIRERFLKSAREGRWRAAHSHRFISKACQVGDSLGVPVQGLLFKC